MNIKYELGNMPYPDNGSFNRKTISDKKAIAFGYIENCENVKFEKINVADVLEAFTKMTSLTSDTCVYEPCSTDTSINYNDYFLQYFKRVFTDPHDIGEKLLMDSVKQTFISSIISELHNAMRESIPDSVIIEDESSIQYILNLLHNESAPNVFYNTISFNVIRYTKTNETYCLITLGTVYLLNDSGKTIDIIK